MIDILVMLAVTASGAFAADATCPGRHKGAPLGGFEIFDGPLAENAVLAPDSTRHMRGVTTEEWGVASVYAAGRRLTLRCSYGRRGALVVALSRPVKQCRARLTKTERSLTCR